MTPAKHLALNLGAPGDRRDASGRVWFAWPRPKSFFGLKLDVKTDVVEGRGYFRHNATTTRIESTDKPWVYSSGCLGLSRCVLHLLDKQHGPRSYTVRLHFVEPAHTRAGRRAFDIRLQGKIVEEASDVSASASHPNRAVVKEFANIEVTGDLLVELATRDHAAALCGIEAIAMAD